MQLKLSPASLLLVKETRPASLSRRPGQRRPQAPGTPARPDGPPHLGRPELPGPPSALHPGDPAALTCVAPFLAVAEALESALGSGLRAHACGQGPRQPQAWPTILSPAQSSVLAKDSRWGEGTPSPAQRDNSVAGTDKVTYLWEAGPWAAGREVEATSCQRTGRSPSPRRGGEGRSAHAVWLLSPRPHGSLRTRLGETGPAAGAEPGSRGGGRRTNVRRCPGTDLNPALTWAAARTFWYKLFPWRGSGGPENTVGRARETELSTCC